MQKISPMLADPLLQIGDVAGQLGSLILQRRDNMSFRHDQHPFDNKGILLPRPRLLKSSCRWRLIHKTADMDGLELIRTIQSTGRRIAIIAVSGGDPSLDLLRAASLCGADAALTKPLDL